MADDPRCVEKAEQRIATQSAAACRGTLLTNDVGFFLAFILDRFYPRYQNCKPRNLKKEHNAKYVIIL